MAKTALITGITGQDGSYLADLLLSKGYEVHGIVRRASTINTSRIDHIYPDLHLHYGDLTDPFSLTNIISKCAPDEIYNLGAQSHVKVSFEIPEYTGQVDALGTLRILESIRALESQKYCRFYQASTSELFGKVQEIPQSETTPFYPRSPYGVAKIYGFWIVKNYRESYGMHASSGILFNHESIPKFSPVIIKHNEQIDILPIEDMFRKNYRKGLKEEYKQNVSVWNGEDWTKILNGTAYVDQKKKTKIIQTVAANYEATYDHVCFDEKNNEIATQDIKVGDKLFEAKYPKTNDALALDPELALFIGYVVGNGYISPTGKIRIAGNDKEQLLNIANILKKMFGYTNDITEESGDSNDHKLEKPVYCAKINNNRSFGMWLRSCILSKRSLEKKIPLFILNGSKEAKKAFFYGYYLAEGKQEDDDSHQYEGFRTNSSALCLGMIYIFQAFSDQTPKCKVYIEENGSRYYHVHFGNPNGEHRQARLNEVIDIINTKPNDGIYYDIQTESQTFATGPNLVKIHNSPRRGETFVTKKITKGLFEISRGERDVLHLGNLDAKRDWGHARDYVEAMWLMLQQESPDDYVIATGKQYSVRDFFDMAAKEFDMDIVWEKSGAIDTKTGKCVAIVDPNYFRPAEVDTLLGDPSKAERVLGWKAKTSLQELVKEMCDHEKKFQNTNNRSFWSGRLGHRKKSAWSWLHKSINSNIR